MFKENIKKWHEKVFNKNHATGGVIGKRPLFFGEDTPYLIVPLKSETAKKIFRLLNDRDDND